MYMKSALVTSYAQLPAFDDFQDPVPTENETLIKVTATGIHPIVKALANGTHYGSTGKFPFVPGVDGVGTTPDGRRVFFGIARPPFGSMAQYTLAGEFMFDLPESVDDTFAAAAANPAMSSWAALAMRAKLQAGESVLILGATGAAGQLAVQIAKHLGARRVVACGRNAAAMEELKALGADATISLTLPPEDLIEAFRNEIAGNGVDVVLDYLWGAPAEALLNAIGQKGLSHRAPRIRFIQIGSSAGPTITLPASHLRSSGVELLGSGFGSASMDELRIAIQQFFEACSKNPFQTKFVARPLEEVTSAWGEPNEPRIVLRPW